MLNRWLCALALSLPFAAGCGVIPDVRLGEDVGIPKVEGSTEIAIPQDYKCGETIKDPNERWEITSSGDQSSCTFLFKQDVTAIEAKDYDSKPELQGARVINGIDLEVEAFAITDPATGKQPEGLKDLTGKAFGITILTEEDLAVKPPFTKSVEGEPVDALKSQVEAKQDIVIPVDVEVVVALDPAPPESLKLDFNAQPVLTVGF